MKVCKCTHRTGNKDVNTLVLHQASTQCQPFSVGKCQEFCQTSVFLQHSNQIRFLVSVEMGQVLATSKTSVHFYLASRISVTYPYSQSSLKSLSLLCMKNMSSMVLSCLDTSPGGDNGIEQSNHSILLFE